MFALHGGKIMVTSSMLKRLKNENELAFIIGHEIRKSLLLGLFFMLLADNYGSVFSATLQVTDAKYSRSQELDADRFGLDTMACAYDSVKDATALFAWMDKGKRWKYFLASHPAFSERVETMKNYIREKGYSDKGKPLPLSEKF